MFIHFLCLCPLRLAIMLNFHISKVAYYALLKTCHKTAYYYHTFNS